MDKDPIMKRKDILRILAAHGFVFREGANHTKVYDANGNYVTTIGRHTEIHENLVRLLEKQIGISLR
jgi:predicted RNA binding protein YcfA (HicA-like mRNA interferase family)